MESLIKTPFGESHSMRKAYGNALVELGKSYDTMYVLSADVSSSDHSYMFEEAFPQRFYNVGIAEQALVDVAAGLALDGKIPIANTFAFLLATRALEQIRTHVCYSNTNVKLVGAYAGLSDSFDGPTHHAITDIAIMRSLPNMSVVVPADALAVKKLLGEAIRYKGPVYFRLCRNEVPSIFTPAYEPELGKGVLLKEGTDVMLVSCGVMVSVCLQAVLELQKQGIQAGLIEMHTIKPFDHDLIHTWANKTGHIVTVEEHSIIGGLGGAVAESIAEMGDIKLEMVGINDAFTECGPYEALLEKNGLSTNAVISKIKTFLGLKNP